MKEPVSVARLLRNCSLARLTPLVLLLLVSGCSTTGQRIALDCPFPPEGGTSRVASTFDDAASCTTTLVGNVRTRLNHHEKVTDAARAATVLGTLGATVSAVYRAHRDTIVGLGLLGGAGFAYGSLYAPPPFLAIYSAGLDAAVCTDAVARQAAGSAKSISAGRKALDEALNTLGDPQTRFPNASASAKSVAAEAIANAQNAQRLAAGLLGQEAHFANGIVNVAYDISAAVDQQLIANTPTLQAFRDAAQSALAIAQGMVPGPSVSTATTRPDPKTEARELPENAADTKALNAATQVVVENTIRLQTVIKAFGNPDATTCSARARNAGIKALTLVPAPPGDEIVLEKGAIYSITVSGGQPPYRCDFAGAEPTSKELVLTQTGDTCRLEAKDMLKREYMLVVRDARTDKPLKVKGKN